MYGYKQARGRVKQICLTLCQVMVIEEGHVVLVLLLFGNNGFEGYHNFLLKCFIIFTRNGCCDVEARKCVERKLQYALIGIKTTWEMLGCY